MDKTDKTEKERVQDALNPAMLTMINEQRELLKVFNQMVALQENFMQSYARVMASMNIVVNKYKEVVDADADEIPRK